MGIGEGLTGHAYALPTKGLNISYMSLNIIRRHVNRFIVFADNNPGATFKVTQVGCGLSNFTPKDIAPMFHYAGKNCYFDTAWKKFLPTNKNFWGTF